MDPSLAIVNIVLLLVFYFLSTGALLTSDPIAVALPETYELPLDQLPKPILIVGEDGTMELNGTPIQPGSLADLLADEPILNVLAERTANAGMVLDTIAGEDLIAVELRLVTVHRLDAGSGPAAGAGQ